MKKIYYVRHGESESNLNGIVSGSGDDIHLTATGHEQAKLAAKKLIDKGIDLIVCSPMIRTVETATVIAKELNYPVEKFVKNKLFVERAYGIYDGKPSHLYEKDLNDGTVHLSVETEQQMQARLRKGIDWLKTLEADTILLVSHGGAGRAIRVLNEKLHHSEMYKLEGFKNCEIYEFDL